VRGSRAKARRVLAVLFALIAAPAAAQTYLRGPDGRDAGRVERGSDGTTRFYDAQGRNAGRGERRSDGSTQFFDSTGRYGGSTSMPGPLPDWTRERQGPPRGGAWEGRR
jgi:hypothetical protein